MRFLSLILGLWKSCVHWFANALSKNWHCLGLKADTWQDGTSSPSLLVQRWSRAALGLKWISVLFKDSKTLSFWLFSVLYAMGHEPIQVERWDLCSPKDFFVERPASLVISKSLFMYSLKSLSSLFHLLSAALTWLSIAPEWGRKSFVTTQICHLFVGKWYESKLLGKSFVSLQTMTPTWSLVLSV